MFPAPAGMSPDPRHMHRRHVGVPRTCGDEPINAFASVGIVRCSPHLRG